MPPTCSLRPNRSDPDALAALKTKRFWSRRPQQNDAPASIFLKINHTGLKCGPGRVSTSGRSMGSTASQPRWNARHAGYDHEPQELGPSGGITIAHAGRQIRFGPVVFWIGVGAVVIMAGWSVATATYFA